MSRKKKEVAEAIAKAIDQPQQELISPTPNMLNGVPEPFQFIRGEVILEIGVPNGRDKMDIQTLRGPIVALTADAFLSVQQGALRQLHEASAKWAGLPPTPVKEEQKTS